MDKMQIEEFIANEKYDEIAKFFQEEKINFLHIYNNLNFDKQISIITKLSAENSAEIFLELDKKLQNLVLEQTSLVEFKPISEKILNSENIEKLDKDILSLVLIRAEASSREEKMIEIIESIELKKFGELKTILSEMEPIDIAHMLANVDQDKIVVLFRLLPKDLASETFVEMPSDCQEIVIKAFTDKELAIMVNDLFADDALDLIEEMPSNVVRRILKVASSETRDSINKLLGYPKDSAGSIMTTECITLRENTTVEQALKKIRKQALDKETIYTCYVTDDTKRLLGIVSIKDILLHENQDKVGDFMEENVIYAQTETDKEEVSQLLSKYDLLAVPIVDKEGRINGIVTIDDAIDVIQQEATEDISKIAGMSPNTKPYLQTSVFSIFRSRIPWLLILLISATFTGLIINTYEATLNSISPLLFACIPMLMDSGGNAGSQASVTIIRALALDEVKFKDIFKIIFKEIRVALMLALVLAVACFVKLQLIDNLIFGYNYTLKISLVISLALFATICVAKIVGAFLPLLAKKCKLDPAVVASPFITTIVDAISLLLFCALSIVIL